MNKFLNVINQAGGRPLLIGGAVIDTIQGREIKDWDIEVHGLFMDNILAALLANEYQVDAVGAAFGVLKVRVGDLDVDISVPRRENKVGVKHTSFTVEIDPNMTPREASRRRDLTINSIYKNLNTNEIIDPYNGLKDLKDGVLKATDPTTFVEDPLRVLRIMQLLPRKGKVVDPQTIELCRSIKDQYGTIASERVFEEFNKLLLKAYKPSLGLQFLADCGWIDNFKALKDLIACEQNPQWHPEGDVFQHTKRALDMASEVKYSLPEEWHLAFMYGVMLHDVGKPSTTKEDFTAYGHDIAGVDIAEKFMKRITNDKILIQRVKYIVLYHMRVEGLFRGKAKIAPWKRLHNKLRLDVCAAMSICDSLSRFGDNKDAPHPSSAYALELFKGFGPDPIPPILMGRHLIEKGIKPGPRYKKILDHAYKLQIDKSIIDIEVLYKRSYQNN